MPPADPMPFIAECQAGIDRCSCCQLHSTSLARLLSLSFKSSCSLRKWNNMAHTCSYLEMCFPNEVQVQCIYLSIYPSIHPSIYLSIHLSISTSRSYNHQNISEHTHPRDGTDRPTEPLGRPWMQHLPWHTKIPSKVCPWRRVPDGEMKIHISCKKYVYIYIEHYV